MVYAKVCVLDDTVLVHQGERRFWVKERSEMIYAKFGCAVDAH